MQCICNLFIEKIDYKGQELAKKIMMIVYILGYTMSLIAGYTLGDLKYVLYGGIATVILVVLLVVPSWPFYLKEIFENEIKTDVNICKNRPKITFIKAGIKSQDSLQIVETEKPRRYDLLANELDLIYKSLMCIVERAEMHEEPYPLKKLVPRKKG
ncbi:hypothetical protein CWI38_0333p0020 [Hamiltosporidium tvaerminnensis]|uniref:Signal peptidase complex subunit 1 n=1 Tax=Hamiltosporidium tvaerminnensis TaxID=1176355 RepID=A0A4Q9LZP8_9MICR|nr:hypothetical protein CWI38_0333p0020 [Hamiltosporidium tvaerminnensis]